MSERQTGVIRSIAGNRVSLLGEDGVEFTVDLGEFGARVPKAGDHVDERLENVPGAPGMATRRRLGD